MVAEGEFTVHKALGKKWLKILGIIPKELPELFGISFTLKPFFIKLLTMKIFPKISLLSTKKTSQKAPKSKKPFTKLTSLTLCQSSNFSLLNLSIFTKTSYQRASTSLPIHQ